MSQLPCGSCGSPDQLSNRACGWKSVVAHRKSAPPGPASTVQRLGAVPTAA
ncbi:hypothetical protein AB0H77_17265 [Streptomyces sp. NPDC050844]|uniref:hypothetical protein n=1 Tax=Streptomyces sp. NPDC050844 TaxID=3155790 RepID=UPI0033CF69A3